MYTYHDGFAVDMRKRFGGFAPAFDPVVGRLSRRLIVAQGFLHSDASPSLEIVMRRSGGRSRLALSSTDALQRDPTLARARRRVARIARHVDLVPLMPLARVGAPGSSFHCGGTFPMREHPGDLETDTLGRPSGLSRVHVVDASVFPSVPATTITFSAMANAHRIATHAVGGS
jgi:choline dehydrogenase-like flavoprotein